MRELEPVEFTPSFQPDPENPVVLRLKPLDLRGQQEIMAGLDFDTDMPKWSACVAASRYIVGWKGGDLGQFSRVRMRHIVDGAADMRWAVWLPEIAAKLYAESMLPETTEKKS